MGGQKSEPPPLSKICQTYATMMKLGLITPYLSLRNTKQCINHVKYLLGSDSISIFHWKSANVSISRKRDCILTPFRMGLFGGCSRMGGGKKAPSLKSVTHPRLMRLGTVIPSLSTEDSKNTKIIRHTPWGLLTSALFHQKSVIFVISGNTGMYCILVH